MFSFFRKQLKVIYTAFLVFSCLFLWGQQSWASWLINAEKFHFSAHGQNTCQDCHEDIAEKDLHPSPLDVNKDLKDFFEADKCLSCHDDIQDNLNEGVHGTKKVEDRKKFEYCIGCHNPHYQPLLGERQGRFDPSKPLYNQCGVCHEEKNALPALSPEDKDCMNCHGSVDLKNPEDKKRFSQLCFHCHGQGETHAQKITGNTTPLINISEYQSVPHEGIACTACHPQSISFNHGAQKPGDCRQCHLPHDEKVTHDAHIGVACEACHLNGVEPVRDPDSKAVLWKTGRIADEPSTIHNMAIGEDKTQCKRCHFKGNAVGAVSMILPAKSMLCMPCHAGTFSVGDTTTIIALIVFLLGIGTSFAYWLSGSITGEKNANTVDKLIKLFRVLVKNIVSPKILLIIKAIVLDVLLQRRLFIQSSGRWLIHSLIFFPFVFRFTWGLLALVSSLCKPDWAFIWPMLNKNNPATAFLFDLTGVMLVFGVGMAFFRGILNAKQQVSGLPRQDKLALGLIFMIVFVGFILEGMRISMTGIPCNSGYSFIGYAISKIFSGSDALANSYGYLWYAHAILTGAFIAYLPFSRLMHIILAPVVLSMNAVQGREQRGK